MVATGELLNKAQTDISLLKSKEAETSNSLADKEKCITDLTAETDLLKAQVSFIRSSLFLSKQFQHSNQFSWKSIGTILKWNDRLVKNWPANVKIC